jgi:hypothetical protein
MTASHPVSKPVSLPDFQNGDDNFQCFTANRVRNGSRKPNFAFTITADVLVEENIAGELDVFTDLLAGLR